MSTTMIFAEKQESSDLASNRPGDGLQRGAASSASCTAPVFPKVWCAPMTEAGEWVITWTRAPGALAYEVQTSLDGTQWSSGAKFSGTRAVLLIGPAQRCWARVRPVGATGPGLWSEPAAGEKCRMAA